MAVSNVLVYQDYDADGAQTTFAIPFTYIPGELSTIVVKTITTAGVVTIKALTTDYTLDPAGNNPTNVIFLVAPADADGEVRVERILEFKQILDYINSGNFQAEDHEKGLDRIVMMIQQLDRHLDRAFKINEADEGTLSTELPKAVAGKVFAISADLTSITLLDPTTFVSGSKFFCGTGAPSSGLGSDDDLYLDLAAPYTLYKKVTGAWVSQGSLQGPTGATGATGATGYEWAVSEIAINTNPLVNRTRYFCSVGGLTLTLPAAPTNGDSISIKDMNGLFSASPCTLARNGNSIEDLAADYTLDADFGHYEFQFRTGHGWALVV